MARTQAPAGTPQLDIELEAGSLRRLVQASKTWDAASKRAMRAKLRTAANTGVDAVKTKVLAAPPSSGNTKGRTGVRAALAAGVKASIRSGVKTEGVRVTVRPKLPAGHEGMELIYMKDRLRHPVFGNRDKWVGQETADYFYGPLRKNRPAYQAAIVAAVEEASQQIAQG